MRNPRLLAGALGLVTTLVTTLAAAGPLRAQIVPPDRELVFTPVAPCRIYDTRAFQERLAPGRDLSLQVIARCGVPLHAAAVALNLVAVNPAGPGHLTAWPAHQPKPSTSVINYGPGVTIANGMVVEICGNSCGNDFTIQAGVSATHVVVDLVGFFASRVGPGAARYGAGAGDDFLCVNNSQNVLFGLSHTVVDWIDAELACPGGTWVCSPEERGTVACNTTRPDGTCDQIDHFGHCMDFAADSHRGWTRPRNGTTGGATVTGITVDEQGVPVSHRFGSQLPVWCCSPF